MASKTKYVTGCRGTAGITQPHLRSLGDRMTDQQRPAVTTACIIHATQTTLLDTSKDSQTLKTWHSDNLPTRITVILQKIIFESLIVIRLIDSKNNTLWYHIKLISAMVVHSVQAAKCNAHQCVVCINRATVSHSHEMHASASSGCAGLRQAGTSGAVIQSTASRSR